MCMKQQCSVCCFKDVFVKALQEPHVARCLFEDLYLKSSKVIPKRKDLPIEGNCGLLFLGMGEHYIWANYSDLSRGHPKWCRFREYLNLPWYIFCLIYFEVILHYFLLNFIAMSYDLATRPVNLVRQPLLKTTPLDFTQFQVGESLYFQPIV